MNTQLAIAGGPENHRAAPLFPRTSTEKKVPVVITLATLYAAFYQIAPSLGVGVSTILFLFILSPFVVIYLAYVIVRYGTPSRFTFDEKFYDDQ